MRQRTGAVLCSSCNRLVHVEEEVCPHCGARAPGLWGFGPALRRVLGPNAELEGVFIAGCVALYLLSLVLEPAAIFGGGMLDAGAPGYRALRALGMTGGEAWLQGHAWTLLTATWLHGSLLHLAFNLLWARNLIPAGVEAFGRARLVVLWCLTGAGAFLVSNLVSNAPTIGASGALFGVLGALWAWGRRRGGVVGRQVAAQAWTWALGGVVFGFLMPAVNNAAHLGGLAVGALLGFVLPNQERQAEARGAQLLALGLLGATLVGFGLSLARWGLPG